ncbi:phospholipase D-like domain-containing protein [Pacificoceanicola onchidii]|uniref:phospholipase D-like domain-containing protein n=1 Tax=Pacificoceanicola onchidii TaxID=2562685 RepID=UPI0010A437E1|nr:phospholipase D-like domain-containing protein [Pacificoceanicola onchidii]
MSATALITAAEGFPELERLVAGAERDLCLSFRNIDPQTRLRAPELQERGLRSWGDLIAWVSRRNVRLRLLLADFDPVFASNLHRTAWASASGFADVVGGKTQILCAPHGQQAGMFWRFLMRKRLRDAVRTLRSEDSTRLTPVQRAVLTSKPVLRPVTLHQKFAIADGARCVIGGMDINERSYDDAEHDRAPEQTWHDISVALEDRDFCGALRGHFADCWNAAIDCGAASLAETPEPIDTTSRPQSRADLKLIRTMSKPCSGAFRLAPEPVAIDHETTLIKLFAEAERCIYIETQYLRHAALVDALVAAGTASLDLQLIMILPAAPDTVLFEGDEGWDARHAHALQIRSLDRLRAAFGDRTALLSPAQTQRAPANGPKLDGAGPIYVHSKVTIVDSACALIGSANLNGRSMRWDSEASVLIRDHDFTGDLLQRLGTYWMGEDAEDGSVERAATWWASAEKAQHTAPEGREGYLLPFPLEGGRDFSRLVPFLPDEMF